MRIWSAVICSLLLVGAARVSADDKLTIAVIPKGTTHDFWKSVEAGAKKAGTQSRLVANRAALRGRIMAVNSCLGSARDGAPC